jgi:hypothetical protein
MYFCVNLYGIQKFFTFKSLCYEQAKTTQRPQHFRKTFWRRQREQPTCFTKAKRVNQARHIGIRCYLSPENSRNPNASIATTTRIPLPLLLMQEQGCFCLMLKIKELEN